MLTTSDSKEPMPKKPRRLTQKRVAKELWGVEAGSGGTGAEGRKKQKPKSFCAASTALRGVMLKQLLRNKQDTRTLCGVVFDTYIVSSQLHAVVAAKAQTHAHNDAVQLNGRGQGLGPPFIWAWAGLVQGLITQGTKLGEVLAPLSDHMEELNKLAGWSNTVESTRLSSHTSAGSLSP